MALKVMTKQVKALLMDYRMLLLAFGAPLVFRFLVPGFDGNAFPLAMIAYVLLGLQSMAADRLGTRVGMSQFPVTAKDHIAGMFLYQGLCVLCTAAMAALFMLVTAGGQMSVDAVLKAVGIGLLLAGLISVAGLWLSAQPARVVVMLLAILTMNLAIVQGSARPVFLSWVSVPAALLIGAAGWGILLALALRVAPRLG